MYSVYRSYPRNSRVRSLALSWLIVCILGIYCSVGVILIQGGGKASYVGAGLLVMVGVILGKSAVEYMYTSPHVKRMRAVPLQDRSIVSLARDVARQFGIPPPEVYVTHYEVPNAFTLGRRGHTVLIITDGLLDLRYDEVSAVFAHELSHAKSNDSLIKTVASVMRSFLFFDPVTRFAFSRIYVEKEFVADERSSVITGKPQDLVSALRKIYKEVSEVGEGLPSKSVLNYSQTVYDPDSLRHRQGIPADPTMRNRFIVERKMMPGSVVQERVKRLQELERRLRVRRKK